MSRKKSKISADIFDAVSAPTRIQTLRLLATRGPLTYSEIMEMLNFEPTKDAGKFVYHLKNLINVGLVSFDKSIKKYKITDLGLMVVNFSQDLEEYALKKAGKMLVRTSRYTIEEFDRSRIAESLMEEAGLPQDLANKISSEVEERLLKLPIRYLTAPLIREFVNAILVESGLEDYRHKLTRLGMPVHDVKKTVEEASQKHFNVNFIRSKAGRRVITEYMLLNNLPREVADAHLSGQIHIHNPGFWVLTPSTIYHDLRMLFSGTLKTQHVNPYVTPVSPPKNLVDAVMLTSLLTKFFEGEISEEQKLDYFNVFLAPFVVKRTDEEVKRILKNFLVGVNPIGFENLGGVSLSVEVTVPQHLKKVVAVKPEETGKEKNCYEDYEEEARKVLSLLLDAFLELSNKKPLFNPRIILNFRPDCLTGKYDEILLKAHKLASAYGTLFIANLTRESETVSSYMANGEKVEANWSKDWEIDTLRVGNLNKVSLNLPRVAYEAKKDDEKLFEGLDKTLELAVRALEIKSMEIGERMRQGLLPNLSSQIKNESYFRLNHSFGTISILGLNEAVKSHLGYEVYEDLMPQHFAIKLLEHLTNRVESFSKKLGLRLSVSQISDVEASQKLAEYDVEKYGWSTVYVQGGKEHPYYTFITPIPDDLEISLDEKFRIEEKFHPLFNGGYFTQIQLEDEVSAEKLLKQTKRICEEYGIEFFAYSHILSYCGYCQKTFRGYLKKCPECGLADITVYGREATNYLPLVWWTHKGRKSLLKKT